MLDQANSQARHLRQQMEQWMTRVGREYDALRTEVEATISHAADQLDQGGKVPGAGVRPALRPGRGSGGALPCL